MGVTVKELKEFLRTNRYLGERMSDRVLDKLLEIKEVREIIEKEFYAFWN